ncbi:hypothetical protein BHE74_00006627 [Ensete ventricosum]|nr:hypothetical protein BHE74_00006627 [Ensete ventricosum]
METAPRTWRSCRRITRHEGDSRRDQALVSDDYRTKGDPGTPKGFGEVDAPSSCRRLVEGDALCSVSPAAGPPTSLPSSIANRNQRTQRATRRKAAIEGSAFVFGRKRRDISDYTAEEEESILCRRHRHLRNHRLCKTLRTRRCSSHKIAEPVAHPLPESYARSRRPCPGASPRALSPSTTASTGEATSIAALLPLATVASIALTLSAPLLYLELRQPFGR